MIRSGLKSVGRTTMPPRAVRTAAPAPSSPMTGISPKAFVGPTATASSSLDAACPRGSRRSRSRRRPGRTSRSSRRRRWRRPRSPRGGTRPPVPIIRARAARSRRTDRDRGGPDDLGGREVGARRSARPELAYRPAHQDGVPHVTNGAEEVNTKMASEVASFGSPSAAGSCR